MRSTATRVGFRTQRRSVAPPDSRVRTPCTAYRPTPLTAEPLTPFAVAAELLVRWIVRTELRAAIRECRVTPAHTDHGALVAAWSEFHSRPLSVERGRAVAAARRGPSDNRARSGR